MDQPFLSQFYEISVGFLGRIAFRKVFLLTLIFVPAIILSACNASTQPEATATLTQTPAATYILLPTLTPTPFPLGTDANPLILGIVSESSDPNALAAAGNITKSIQQLTGFVISARSYPSYSLLVADLSVGKVQIAFLPPLTYLYAREMGFARVAMLANHFGVYQYGSRFFANVASQFKSFYDPSSDHSTGDASVALPQFKGKRPCWIDSSSPSGFIVPLGLLKQNHIEIPSGAFVISPTGVIRALYVTGICDFGVTFSTTGDPRTSPAVAQDLTDVLNRVVIIWQSDPIIPNLNLSFHPSIRSDMQDDLIFAFKDLIKNDAGKAALSAANAYDILDLKQVDDSVYDPLNEVVLQTGINLASLVGR